MNNYIEIIAAIGTFILASGFGAVYRIFAKRINRDLSYPIAAKHNLPAREVQRFVDREEPLEILLEFFKTESMSIISIEGLGGIGKSSLAIEAAYSLMKVSGKMGFPTYEAIIYSAGRYPEVTSEGLLPGFTPARFFKDICSAISVIFGVEFFGDLPFDDAIYRIKELLGTKQILLILDNYEYVPDKKEILHLITSLPESTKVLVTSRDRTGFRAIRLEPLTLAASVQLVELVSQQINLHLEDADVYEIAELCQGHPLTLILTTHQFASQPISGISRSVMDMLLSSAKIKKLDYLEYLVGETIKRLPDNEKELLEILSRIPNGTSLSELFKLVKFNNVDVVKSIGDLISTQLVKQNSLETFQLHPLVFEYMQLEQE